MVVILPDGGRSYLSKIYSDTWMTQHGFLERRGESTVGDALAAKRPDGGVPRLVTVASNQKVRDVIALLHEHSVSQLPVVSAHDPQSVVGSIGERGLLKQAVGAPDVLESEVVHVMEAPFPAVSAGDPVREAMELLAGERQALLVLDEGRPAGILTRADLLETMV
jgi:cystathionine beta-synthase